MVEASRVFHLALTYASTTTTTTRFVAKSTARLRWACGGGKLLGRLTDTHRRRDGARRVAVPVFERARPLWQEEEGGRRGGEGWMKDGEGEGRKRRRQRVGGGACQEQTTAAILHVNGISKRMICAPQSDQSVPSSMMFRTAYGYLVDFELNSMIVIVSDIFFFFFLKSRKILTLVRE